jgi:hypothetical protein
MAATKPVGQGFFAGNTSHPALDVNPHLVSRRGRKVTLAVICGERKKQKSIITVR